MKVAATSDWRDALGFDVPVLVADLLPGEPARCSLCGGESGLVPRTELWAVKHRHPKHHSGHVRFYCREHVPVLARPEPPPAPGPRRPAAREARPPARRAPAIEKQRPICPDCFVEIPPTGVCGVCGRAAD